MNKRRYIFDLRINTTLTVDAGTVTEAWELANAKMRSLSLSSGPDEESLPMDLEDGLEMMDVEDIGEDQNP